MEDRPFGFTLPLPCDEVGDGEPVLWDLDSKIPSDECPDPLEADARPVLFIGVDERRLSPRGLEDDHPNRLRWGAERALIVT